MQANGDPKAEERPGGSSHRTRKQTLLPDADSVIAACTRALKADQGHSQARSMRAWNYLKKGAYAAALEDYNVLLREQHDSVDALLHRGILFEKLARYDDAIADFTAVLRLEESHYTALYHRATCYNARGHFHAAIDDYNNALRYDPSGAMRPRPRPHAHHQQRIAATSAATLFAQGAAEVDCYPHPAAGLSALHNTAAGSGGLSTGGGGPSGSGFGGLGGRDYGSSNGGGNALSATPVSTPSDMQSEDSDPQTASWDVQREEQHQQLPLHQQLRQQLQLQQQALPPQQPQRVADASPQQQHRTGAVAISGQAHMATTAGTHGHGPHARPHPRGTLTVAVDGGHAAAPGAAAGVPQAGGTGGSAESPASSASDLLTSGSTSSLWHEAAQHGPGGHPATSDLPEQHQHLLHSQQPRHVGQQQQHTRGRQEPHPGPAVSPVAWEGAAPRDALESDDPLLRGPDSSNRDQPSRPTSSRTPPGDAGEIASRRKAVEYHHAKGFALRKQHNYAAAVDQYSKALALDPAHFKAWFNRGFSHDKLGDHARAIADYTRAVELEPNSSYAHYNRGITLDRMAEYDRAVADFSRAIELDGANADFYHNRGFTLRKQGRYEEAVRDYSKAIALQPGHCRAYYNRAFCYDKLGCVADAIADYSRALDEEPGNALAYFNRGGLLERCGRYEEALRDYRDAAKADPSGAHALIALGVLQQALGRHQEALGAFDAALALQPGNAALHRSRAQSRYCLNDYPGSVQDLTSALRLQPQDLLSRIQRAHAFRRQAEYEAAIRDYTYALEHVAADVRVKLCINRAYCYAKIDLFQEAIADYDAVLAVDPDNVHARHNRGISLEKLEEHLRAARDFDSVLRGNHHG